MTHSEALDTVAGLQISSTTRQAVPDPRRRRTQQRYDVRLPVEFTFQGNQYHGHSRNMSVGGMFLETAARLPFNGIIRLTITVPTHKEPIEVDAQVRWIESRTGATDGVGVRFQGLRAVHVWALNKFLADKPPSG